MMTNEEINALNITVNEASAEIDKKNYIKGAELLAYVIKQCGGKFNEDGQYIYLSFNNPLEHFIYVSELKPEKAVYDLTFNISEAYRLYGKCMAEMQKLENAEKALSLSAEFNPVSVSAMLEFADFYRVTGDYDAGLEWIKQAHYYSYSAEYLAKCFRYYAIYYFDIEKYENSAAMNYVSLSIKNSIEAQAELYHIQSQTGKFPKRPSREAVSKLLARDEIQSGPTKSVINTAYSLGMRCYKDKKYGLALYCFERVYEFTRSSEISSYIIEIKGILKNY